MGSNLPTRISKNPKINEIQLRICYEISKMGEINFEKLSKTLEIPKSTIYYNYKKLIDDGIVKGPVLDVNETFLGLDITAVTLVKTKYMGASGERVGDKIAKIPGVSHVYYVLGDIDFVVLSKAKNRTDLKRIINSMAEIEEVERTSSIYVLNVIKEERDFFKNYPFDFAKQLFLGEADD